ncbi:MAG TPA: AAA family ATPase [Candidatus Dormibacteraeota bacterium]|nr:AAA family ATPase [Candidatus Dormibacteraeota bacterium]
MTEERIAWLGDRAIDERVELATRDPEGEAEAVAPVLGSPAWWDAQPTATELAESRAERLRRDAGGIDAVDLLALELAPLRAVVPDVVYEGTTVIAAEPKIGKSTLVYQLCVEVALGGELLGRRVASGSSLYLALEDGHRRGQARLRGALAGRTMPKGRLEVRWSAPMIGAGLEESIAAWLDAHADAAVVAIDTLGKVRPHGDSRRNAYQVDVEDLGRLQALFRDRPTALVIVHHARKQSSDDFLASVSGTYGIAGSADTVIVVRRKRHEEFGTLDVTGRDVAEAEVPVRFVDGLWRAAPAALPEASFERMQVFRVIESHGPLFPKAIADMTGLERTSVQHLVSKLVDTGAVMRSAKGYVSRARTVPDNSGHSGSEWSEAGHTREAATVGDRMAHIFAAEPERADEIEPAGLFEAPGNPILELDAEQPAAVWGTA